MVVLNRALEAGSLYSSRVESSALKSVADIPSVQLESNVDTPSHVRSIITVAAESENRISFAVVLLLLRRVRSTLWTKC